MSNRTQLLTAELPTVLQRRSVPAVTVWNRLEARPRTEKFDRALKAEVRDALWMITKQWQLGEFRGDDAGSPISAKIRVTTTRLRHYRPDAFAVEPFDDTLPLETEVERRPPVFTLDLRLLLGRQWLKMLPFADLMAEYLREYKIVPPDPNAAADATTTAHAESWSAYAAVAGRRMDGAKLYMHLQGGGHAWDNIAGVAGRKAQIDQVATAFVGWFEHLIAQPPKDSGSWIPSRLEYQFACSAPVKGGEKVLTGDEYYHGHLDWYSVDIDPKGVLDPSPDPKQPESARQVVIPGAASFDGMPNSRWWTFEEGRTNFGDIKPDTTDLAKLLLIEFGLTAANDWYLVPYRLAAGSIAHVDGIAVTNVFGERMWIEAAGRGIDDDLQRWAMFLSSIKGKGRDVADTSLLLLPTAPKVHQGPVLEEILLVRDEVANMVWGIENIISLPNGEPKRGIEAARELRAWYSRNITAPLESPPSPPGVCIRYEVMNTVPENWIPFIPVHRPGSNRAVQLQRAAMLRILAGDPEKPKKVRPRTSILRHGLEKQESYFLHEEEVPRSGVIVTQQYQRTRWRGGRVWVWLGARKKTGHGEAKSGLAFDQILDVPQS